MNAVFTRSAVDKIKEIAADPASKAELGRLMESLNAARSLNDLEQLGLIDVSRRGNRDVFVIGMGRWKALVTVEKGTPDRMVVGSVFHVDEGNTLNATGVIGDTPVTSS